MVDMLRVASGEDDLVPVNIKQSGKHIENPIWTKQSQKIITGPDNIEIAKKATAVKSDAPTKTIRLSRYLPT